MRTVLVYITYHLCHLSYLLSDWFGWLYQKFGALSDRLDVKGVLWKPCAGDEFHCSTHLHWGDQHYRSGTGNNQEKGTE